MLPWSDEMRKNYVVGKSYCYVRLIAARRDPVKDVIDHFPGIYLLAEPFVYEGKQPILDGFKLLDGSRLDSTFCELVSDEVAERNEVDAYFADKQSKTTKVHINPAKGYLFSQRKQLARDYYQWLSVHPDAIDEPFNVISFLDSRGLLQKNSMEVKKIEFPSTKKIDKFGPLLPEFMEKIFGIKSYLVTDESSLYDFDFTLAKSPIVHNTNRILKKIKKIYGIDVSKVKNLTLHGVLRLVAKGVIS